MLITKADGTQEQFKPQKLRASLRRAGASKNETDRIVKHIEESLTEGDKTQVIYRDAFKMLQKDTHPSAAIAAKYSLRRALFGLGPTGFPFEDFLGRLYQKEGYEIRTGILVEGKCATHEIDLAAFKENDSFVAEAKFHARQGIRSDLQVAMYSYARFLDIKARPVCPDDICGVKRLVVITNTKFTSMAIRYAECVGIDLISWGYPKGGTLQQRIEKAGIYPITVLTTLSKAQKQQLIATGAILCEDITKNPQVLKQLGISSQKMHLALEEAKALCVSI